MRRRSMRSSGPTSISCATHSARRGWNSMRSRAIATTPRPTSNCWATLCIRPTSCTMRRRTERYRHIINRLNKVPELIRQAEANLQDSPETWNRVAREENAGNVDLIDATLRADCPPGERMRYDQAAAAAIAALNGFNHWLEDNLAEKMSDWRLGKERYAKKFRLSARNRQDPETLLAEAEADLAKTRAEIARLAAPKTVEQALADVARQHATRFDLHSVGQAGVGRGDRIRQSQGLADAPAERESGGHRDARHSCGASMASAASIRRPRWSRSSAPSFG